MNEHFVDLTDGTRLQIKVNFGTIYYLQKQKGFYRIQKKVEKAQKTKEKRNVLTNQESFKVAADVVYALLRSNGKMVTFDEALALIPPDAEQIERVLDAFQEEYDRYATKKQTATSVVP